MSDTILETLAKLNDLSRWDVKYNVPIFSEHEMWEIPDPTNPSETVRIAILPDQPKPSAGKHLYSVGVSDLQKITHAINRRLNQGTPATIFIGHSNPAAPQKYQPDIVGYGVGAELKQVGPKQRWCVVTRQQLDKSKATEAKQFPKRSAEYNYLTGELTGYGLFKTDVKLPLGDILYSSTVAGYPGQFKGFQCYAKDAATTLYAAMPDIGEETQSSYGGDPTAPPDATELQGPELDMANRFMKHYEQHHPVMRYMCAMHQQQMSQGAGQQGATPPGSPMPGSSDAPHHTASEKPSSPTKPRSPATEVRTDMATDAALSIQYAQLAKDVADMKAANAKNEQRLAALQTTNASLQQNYAMEQSKRILTELIGEGYIIKNPAKAIESLMKTDDAGRADYANNVRENYAKAEQAPTGPMIGIWDEPTQNVPARSGPIGWVDSTKGIPATGKRTDLDGSAEEVDAVVRYAHDNKIDLEAKGSWEKCLEAIRKSA